MDLDDILGDERNDDDASFYTNMILEQLDHEQVLISTKKTSCAFSIEISIVNSKAFHDKFEKLPISKNVQEKLYKEVGRLLEFTDNLDEERMEQERMSILDYPTGNHILDNFDRDGSIYKTGLTPEEMGVVRSNPNSVIVIHNHSHNGRPSGKDLFTFLEENKVKLSIIACHNGDLYAIYWVKPTFSKFYDDILNKKKEYILDKNEAERIAMTEIYQINNALSDRHKYFKVEKL